MSSIFSSLKQWYVARRLASSVIPPIPTGLLPCAEEQCSAVGKLFFTWISPIVATGYKRTISEHDIPAGKQREEIDNR